MLFYVKFIYWFLLFLLKHAQKNKTLDKHLTSKLQVSPNFTLDSVADSNYRGKCDIGGFLIFEWTLYAVHDYFKHAGGRDIFLLDWRQVLSYDVSFLNIRIVVNSVINLVNKNLPRTALQICMFHFNYNFHLFLMRSII
jgi:hypothetical protein